MNDHEYYDNEKDYEYWNNMKNRYVKDEIDFPKIKTILLERIYQTMSYTFPKEEIKNHFDFYLREYKDYVALEIVNRFMGINQVNNIRFETPKTWKDHFKMQYRNNWLMKWWLKKYPIQVAKHEYNVVKTTCFPKLDFPNDKQFMEIHFYNSTKI